MNWDTFIYFGTASVICWAAAGCSVYTCTKKRLPDIFMAAGTAILLSFIVLFWMDMGRPPMRTMGETRLWYSFFLASAGHIIYKRWRYKWLLSFASAVASVFVIINLLKPEIHSAGLMPALQSYWFIPHVTVYILSYALLGAATVTAVIQLVKLKKGIPDRQLYVLADNLVYSGFGLLVLGMLMGAVWAKEAWGHYWTWDPKETWAFITGMTYLCYIHMRKKQYSTELTLWTLPVAFVILMVTWIGVNYLPAAQSSIHVY